MAVPDRARSQCGPIHISTTFTVSITDVDDVAPAFTSSDTITLNENVQNVVSLT